MVVDGCKNCIDAKPIRLTAVGAMDQNGIQAIEV
jgi:hypothetical protein